MKRVFTIIICSTLFVFGTHAQISNYSVKDITDKVVFLEEDMDEHEVKAYKSYLEDGYSKKDALLYINAARAQNNLEDAPPAIINFCFLPEVTREDSVPEGLGACCVIVELINASTKTINEITLEFEFYNGSTQLLDSKTGNKYCILKFKNLKGRPNSDYYEEIREKVFNCYHLLEMKDASYRKFFYNKKVKTIRLHRAIIKYADGTTSNKIAIFATDNLLENGPLKPYIKMVEFFTKS